METTAQNTLDTLSLQMLKPGDILHLKVNTGITSHHSVRPIIYHTQKHYSDIKNMSGQATSAGLKQHENSLDLRKDLNRTGHQTIYVGNGELVEVTGSGVEKRVFKDIDSASYVVVRPSDRNVANSIVEIAKALSERDLKQLANLLQSAAPQVLKSTIDKIRALVDKNIGSENKYAQHSYDTVTATKGLSKNSENSREYNPLNKMITSTNKELNVAFVCSTFAAAVIDIAEKQNNVKELTIKKKPKYTTPGELDFYLRQKEKKDEYTTMGWFHNLGSMHNKDSTETRILGPKAKIAEQALSLMQDPLILSKINLPEENFNTKNVSTEMSRLLHAERLDREDARLEQQMADANQIAGYIRHMKEPFIESFNTRADEAIREFYSTIDIPVNERIPSENPLGIGMQSISSANLAQVNQSFSTQKMSNYLQREHK